MADRVEEFKNHILDGAVDLPPDVEIEFRKMFGGMGAYARGRFFAATCGAGFKLKFSDEDVEVMRKEPGAEVHERTTDTLKWHYVNVPPGVVSDKGKLRTWVERSVMYVLAQPLSKRKQNR